MEGLVPASIPPTMPGGSPNPKYVIYCIMIDTLEQNWGWNHEQLCKCLEEQGVYGHDRGQAKANAMKALRSMKESSKVPAVMRQRATALLAAMSLEAKLNKLRHEEDYKVTQARKAAMRLAAQTAAERGGQHVHFDGQFFGPVASASTGGQVHQNIGASSLDSSNRDTSQQEGPGSACLTQASGTGAESHAPSSTASEAAGAIMTAQSDQPTSSADVQEQTELQKDAHHTVQESVEAAAILNFDFLNPFSNPLFVCKEPRKAVRLPRTLQHVEDEESEEDDGPIASPITTSKRKLSETGLVMLALNSGYSVTKEADGSINMKNRKYRRMLNMDSPVEAQAAAGTVNFTRWTSTKTLVNQPENQPTRKASGPFESPSPAPKSAANGPSNSKTSSGSEMTKQSERPGIGQFKAATQGQETISSGPAPLREALQELKLNETDAKVSAAALAPPSIVSEDPGAPQGSQMKPADAQHATESAPPNTCDYKQSTVVRANAESQDQDEAQPTTVSRVHDASRLPCVMKNKHESDLIQTKGEEATLAVHTKKGVDSKITATEVKKSKVRTLMTNDQEKEPELLAPQSDPTNDNASVEWSNILGGTKSGHVEIRSTTAWSFHNKEYGGLGVSVKESAPNNVNIDEAKESKETSSTGKAREEAAATHHARKKNAKVANASQTRNQAVDTMQDKGLESEAEAFLGAMPSSSRDVASDDYPIAAGPELERHLDALETALLKLAQVPEEGAVSEEVSFDLEAPAPDVIAEKGPHEAGASANWLHESLSDRYERNSSSNHSLMLAGQENKNPTTSRSLIEPFRSLLRQPTAGRSVHNAKRLGESTVPKSEAANSLWLQHESNSNSDQEPKQAAAEIENVAPSDAHIELPKGYFLREPAFGSRIQAAKGAFQVPVTMSADANIQRQPRQNLQQRQNGPPQQGQYNNQRLNSKSQQQQQPNGAPTPQPAASNGMPAAPNGHMLKESVPAPTKAGVLSVPTPMLPLSASFLAAVAPQRQKDILEENLEHGLQGPQQQAALSGDYTPFARGSEEEDANMSPEDKGVRTSQKEEPAQPKNTEQCSAPPPFDQLEWNRALGFDSDDSLLQDDVSESGDDGATGLRGFLREDSGDAESFKEWMRTSP